MYLHIGDDFSILNKDIIGIFNIDNLEYVSYNNSFLRESDEEGFVRKIGNETPKSFVLCHVDGKPLIYLSPISSKTLLRRNNRINDINFNNITNLSSKTNNKKNNNNNGTSKNVTGGKNGR